MGSWGKMGEGGTGRQWDVKIWRYGMGGTSDTGRVNCAFVFGHLEGNSSSVESREEGDEQEEEEDKEEEEEEETGARLEENDHQCNRIISKRFQNSDDNLANKA